jgi:formyl-CoA transferase
MLANNVFVPLKEPLGDVTHTVNSPMTVAGYPKVAPGRAPERSEHAMEILRELDFSPEDAATLIEQGAIGGFSAFDDRRNKV